MSPHSAARELGLLLRMSQEIDVVGDVTAIVANPSELIAWATTLSDPTIVAWQAEDSGRRYVQVSATHQRVPVRGHVAAVLHCEQHPEFWDGLTAGRDFGTGRQVALARRDLTDAWAAMPVAPPA